MSKIAEILESGRAPGFSGAHKDPQSADVAIPRALKQMENQGHSARKIAKDAGYSINTLKRVWNV